MRGGRPWNPHAWVGTAPHPVPRLPVGNTKHCACARSHGHERDTHVRAPTCAPHLSSNALVGRQYSMRTEQVVQRCAAFQYPWDPPTCHPSGRTHTHGPQRTLAHTSWTTTTNPQSSSWSTRGTQQLLLAAAGPDLDPDTVQQPQHGHQPCRSHSDHRPPQPRPRQRALGGPSASSSGRSLPAAAVAARRARVLVPPALPRLDRLPQPRNGGLQLRIILGEAQGACGTPAHTHWVIYSSCYICLAQKARANNCIGPDAWVCATHPPAPPANLTAPNMQGGPLQLP